MKKLKLTITIVFLCFISCKTHISLRTNKVNYIDTNLYSLKYYLQYENLIKSKDISINRYIDISENIYPYIKNHKLQIAKTFLRDDEDFNLTVKYYFNKNKKVKLILYEWNKKNINSDFETKFENIIEFLNRQIGIYDIKKIEIEEESFNTKTLRDDVKWQTKDTKAYLFRFKNNFNQIRLAIYKD